MRDLYYSEQSSRNSPEEGRGERMQNLEDRKNAVKCLLDRIFALMVSRPLWFPEQVLYKTEPTFYPGYVKGL